jgi:putative transposase
MSSKSVWSAARTAKGMNPARVQPEDYIQFLLATPKVCSATEAARVQPTVPNAPAHDAFTRLLHRLEPDPATLWSEVAPRIDRCRGVLVLDDSTLDKPYAHHMQMVGYHWSGNHHRVVKGINLLTLLWTDGDCLLPCDYRVAHKVRDQKTKNDHFADLLAEAQRRGFQPECVLFDGWYAGLENLKRVRAYGWVFLTRFKANRKVRLAHGPATPLEQLPLGAEGTVVWLPGFGEVKVFRVVATNGDTEYWATNDRAMDELQRLRRAEWSWGIEEYHRGLKQYCGVERCQVRDARGQRNHLGCSIRAFMRLEWHRFTTGVSWFEAKMQIIRGAVRAYLANPIYRLEPPTA